MNPGDLSSPGRPTGRLTLGLLVAVAALSALLQVPSTPPVHAQLDPDNVCRRPQMAVRACRLAQADQDGSDAQRILLRAAHQATGDEAAALASAPRLHLHEIYHADGRKVGEIYVDRAPSAASYVEHWVMFDTYEYPDSIRPADEQRYASEQDFLSRVPFGPGYRYARWDVAEQTRIPGR
jgi:hypothetical protein